MTAHCILTEPSVSPQVRKGREGKGTGKGTGKGREVKHPCSSLTVGIDAPPLEAWMLADLDLLDDEKRHARCGRCYPIQDVQLLQVFVALCGRKATVRHAPSRVPPPSACPECLELNGHGCQGCGGY